MADQAISVASRQGTGEEIAHSQSSSQLPLIPYYGSQFSYSHQYLRSIAPNRLTQGSAEKVRLYFLLAWFHAVVQERLRYVPLSWSKTYDFNNSDMATAFAMIVPFLFGSHHFVEITYSCYVIQERDILSSSLSPCTLGLYKTKNCKVEHIGKDLGRKGVDGNWLGSYKALDPGLVDLNLPVNTEELLLKVLFFLYDIEADR